MRAHVPQPTALAAFVIAAALAPAAGCRSTVEVVDPVARAIDVYLSRAVPFGYSGSALVARGDTVLLSKGYGIADDRTPVPNTADTVHPIGSVTKQFTAAAIMKLWMAGKLDPQDKLRRFFPDAPADKADITLHQLLTHTAGITNYTGDDYAEASRDQMKQTAFAAPLDFPAGTQYRYSNAGYSLLAAVVELASGQPYETYLYEELLAPAGMEHTGYRRPDWSDSMLSRAYVGTEDKGTNLEKIFPSWNVMGNGEILSTAGDMYRWHVALSGEEILSAAAKERLYKPDRNDYAYGWNVRTTPRGKLISHNGGSDQGTGCEYRRYPDSNAVIVLFSNRDSLSIFFSAGMGEKVETLLFGGQIALPPGDEEGVAPSTAALPSPARWALPDGSTFELLAQPNLHIAASGRTAIELLAFAPREPPPELAELTARAERAFAAALAGDDSVLASELTDASRLERWMAFIRNVASDVPPPHRARLVAFKPSNREVGDLVASIFITNDKTSRELALYFKGGKFSGLGGGEDVSGVFSMRILPRGPGKWVGHDLASGATVELELRKDGAELAIGGKAIAKRP